MMKRSFQWLSALALMVMGALAFVACSSNDGDGGVPDNSKIVGTWVVNQVSPNDGNGPKVGMEMTFNANGTFTSGEHDNGTYTYNSETGAFTATMGDMTMAGTFTVNGDEATGSVNVTVGGETRTYTMKMSKKGSEPAVSSTKMVGTWKVMRDDSPYSSKGATVVFKEDGTLTENGVGYKYDCEELEDGSLHFWAYENDGETVVSEGWLVLVNSGNVLNGYYQYAPQTKGEEEAETYAYVLKKQGYNYPTSGVQGRWQFTYVAQPYGGYDDYFAKRLPVQYYNEDGITYVVNEVFVIGGNGELYVEGDPHVGNYTINNGNQLDLQFAGKYVAKVHGLIEFSGDDTMNIPQGKGTFKSSATSGETIGFRGTIQRVTDENSGDDDDDETTVSSTKMVGTWEIAASAYPGIMVGKQMVFNKNGTFTYNNITYQYTCEERSDGRLRFELYNYGDNEYFADGKFVLVSEGNVLSGEYQMDGVQEGEDEEGYLSLVLRKPGYTYPTGGVMGRWKMTQCSIDAPMLGKILVFGKDGELYKEGDPHIDSYTYNSSTKKIKMVFPDGDDSVVVEGTVTISNNTMSLSNATVKMTGQTISMTATLVKQ